MCTHQRSVNGDQALDTDYWLDRIEELAAQGQRVLAIAFKPANPKQTELEFSDLENDLIILGMLGLIDPPREEAVEAVHICDKAGIRVKMITGDHGATARAIAQQLKLVNTDDVLTGVELEEMSEEVLSQRVLDVDIYARVNPEHKLRLVRLLQEHGLIVAMTGDGVNDAPALKQADVGISMGIMGTDVARDSSDLVLADDNFATVVNAVEEGRIVFTNSRQTSFFLVTTNIAESVTLLVSILLGLPLPLTATQILWLNLVTDGVTDMALATEPGHGEIMKASPLKKNENILVI